ncbi:MAG: NfeD family protein [Faecalibacterium sp.]
MEFSIAYAWLCLIAVLLIAEAMTVNLVTIWFALGALAALLVSFIVPNPAVQGAVFMIVSTILLLATLPLVKRMRRKKNIPLGADRNIGRTALVVSDITPGEQGRVRLDGVDWSAICAHPLTKGESCRVSAIDSTVLTVEPIPETAVL